MAIPYSKHAISDSNIESSVTYIWTSPVAPMAKNPPATWETRVQSLRWEDPLEGEMATHSSVLAWRIPWTEEPGGLVHGVTKSLLQLSDSLSSMSNTNLFNSLNNSLKNYYYAHFTYYKVGYRVFK